MSHQIHHDHAHVHSENCGHLRIEQDGHVDYLHDGHLHHPTTGGRVEEHVLEVSAQNPDSCTAGHECSGHSPEHVHGPGCGHPAVPHGDHIDYLVDGHLHHQHDGHCDNHGTVQVLQ